MRDIGNETLSDCDNHKQITLDLNVLHDKQGRVTNVRPLSCDKTLLRQKGRRSQSHSESVPDKEVEKVKKNVIFCPEEDSGGCEVPHLLVCHAKPSGNHSPGTANGEPPPRRISSAISHSSSSATRQALSKTRRQLSSSAQPPQRHVESRGCDNEKRLQTRRRLSSRESSTSTASENGIISLPLNSHRGKRKVNRLKPRSNLSESSGSDENVSSSRSTPRTASSSVPPTPSVASTSAMFDNPQRLIWMQFENHVKLIDDSTDLIARQPRKTFNSSGTFQTVMCDLYGNSEYGKSKGFTRLRARVGNIATYASRFIGKVKALHARREYPGDELDDEDDDYLDEILNYQPSRETIENAQRGWKILRQYVQELAAEKRMSQSTLTWDMLRHTIRGLSNMERARHDLYRRYGVIPMVLSDGTVVQENTMLSERARSALANKPNALSTPPSRLGSAVPRRRSTYKPIDGFVGRMGKHHTTL